VDLRAEEDLHVDEAYLASLGLRYVPVPVRDGQAPSSEEVDRFLQAVRETDGITFVHCGAGVGRTGTMAASYLVATGQATSKQALQRNLAVGPPSLEQVAFVAELDGSDVSRPSGALVAVSRVLDAPRRLWSRYGL
jgi:protein-tyrosine phosphatase